MALKESGVRLIAAGYEDYIQKMQQINKAHQQAFNQQPVQDYNKGMASAEKATGKLSGTMSKVAKVAKIAAVALGAMKLAQFAKDSAMVAARAETLRVVLKQVGTQAGYSEEQIAFALKSVKAMGITTAAAAQSLVQMAQANVEWADASKLARLAQDAAVIANINSSEAFNRLITGMQRGNTIMLRTMGLNVDFQKAYQETANTLGKTKDELTEAEMAQARVNAVMKAGEAIAGSYEAAYETVGKGLTSLPRLIEDAQEAWGELFKPLLKVRVEMEKKLWKALGTVGEGMKGLAQIIDKTLLPGLGEAGDSVGSFIDKLLGIREGEDIWDQMARGAHDWSRVIAQAGAIANAFIITIEQQFSRAAKTVSDFWRALTTGDIEGLRVSAERGGKSFGDTFAENFQTQLAEAMEKYDIAFTPFEELGDVAETSLEKATSAVDRNIEALRKQQAQLQNQAEALEQVEDIYRDYNEAIAEANEEIAEERVEFARKAAKAEQKLLQRHQKDLAQLAEDADEKRAELIQEANQKRVEEEKKVNLELEQERRRYELSQLQSLRRFTLEETRLRASGDILGLIRLREDYALQQKEAQENRQLELKEEQETQQAKQASQAEDLQQRLQKLQEETAKQRQEVIAAYHEELAEMQVSNAEKRAEMEKAHQERLQDAIAARNEDIADLGRALQEEGKLTKEGMEVIADEIAKVFGDEGAGSALIEGWSERAQNAVVLAVGNIQSQIQALDEAITTLEEGGRPNVTATGVPFSSLRTRGRQRRGVGMRTGGAGIVTGPASFDVEPGVREAYSFVPLPASGVLNVQMSGGFDITGAEGATPGTVDTAVERMVVTLEEAVRRFRRGGQ
jgi:hypothetical protein